MSTSSFAFMASRLRVRALHELALHRQLVGRQPHGLLRGRLGDAGELEHHPAGLDHRHPPLGRALARAHAGLGGLLGDGPVGVEVDPHLAPTANMAGHGDTGRLDLPVADPGRLQRLQAVLAEGHRGPALGDPAAGRAVLLAVLHALWGEHLSLTLLGARGLGLGLLPGLAAGASLPAAGLAATVATATAVAAGAATATAAAVATVATATARGGARPGTRPVGLLLAGGQHVAAVDPHFDADLAEGGARLGQAVVDVGPQRVQGHTALAVALGPGHLRAAQAAGALHADALGPRLHGRVDGAAHGPPERDPAGELLGRALDLEDVQGDLLAGDLVEVGADAVGLGAPAADHHARPCRVDVDPHTVTGALDLHPGDAGVGQVALEIPADLDVLVQVAPVVLLAEPARLPVRRDPEPEAVRVDLLSHYASLLSTTTVM